MEQIIDFDTFSSVRSLARDYAQLDDAYAVTHIAHEKISARIYADVVLQSEGLALLMLRRGQLKIELNLNSFELNGPALCMIHPMSRMVFYSDGIKDADLCVLYMSEKFLQNLNINFSAFTQPNIGKRPSPVQELTADEYDLLERYMQLLAMNADNPTTSQLAWNLGSSLLSALVYEMAKIQYRRINQARGEADSPHSSRMAYVQDFIKLVRAHYTAERSVAFYASKLCISPKYLSLIVKESTGRSAARWIDEFVLMEAKNLLRYSGKNIQQVAYALNFSNQSAFGKYFKHLTGMSPTEYQKS